MQMSTKQVFLALTLVAILGLAAPHAQAQVVGGGYVGFAAPGVSGARGFRRTCWRSWCRCRRSTRRPLRGSISHGRRPAIRLTVLLRGGLGRLWPSLSRCSSLLPRRICSAVVKRVWG